MPAHRRVNQHQKRDRLPSAEALRGAGDAITGWWSAACLDPADTPLPRRFGDEARASLPGLAGLGTRPAPDDVLAALGLQRLRFRQDQGVPEWP